ncbi:hypothetical protein HPB47_008684 [Ixodes persulcatus]|uniref:Uncharacterized protein n=1 Tax=Ixodes persulcatus TaxID=34615 RepID=A0AC60P435_IXOPE|nr:hypothetical protein HPB47_008684 [Ixodes persulcatus]
MNNTKESVILAGDFNKHNLKLLNDANTPTRFGASAQQDDTSPDLTWASPGLRTLWSVYTDTMGTKRYTLELDRSTWQIHCNSFNERTGLKKVRRTYKGMAGKTNKNTGSNLALHLHISEDELATLAAETFFPQPSTPSPSDCYQIQTENAHLPEDSLFTMGELRTLETLNHAAMRVITGLPKITPVAQLHSAAQLNSIREIAAEMLISQKLRLQRTQAGRLILSHLGDPVFQVPSNAPPNPPWEDTIIPRGIYYLPLNPHKAVAAPPIPIQPKFPWTHWSAGRPLVSPERRDLLLSFLRRNVPSSLDTLDGRGSASVSFIHKRH